MHRRRSLPWALALAAATLVAAPWVAEASDPYLVVPTAEVVDHSPAYRYANMSEKAALDELGRRKILYQRTEPHGAVRTPIRLTGRLHGVHIHSSLPEKDRPTTPFEICDARFALALDDFSALLARHDIVELVHYTMYRPAAGNVPHGIADSKRGAPGWIGSPLAKKGASRKHRAGAARRGASHRAGRKGSRGKRSAKRSSARAPAARRPKPSRHPLGLAIDAGVFVKRDGSLLSVASHFHGKVGSQTCGPGASPPQESHAKELWSIVCETFDQKIFTYVLTPNFDARHQDHFHMDIKPGVRWFLYH